VRAPWPGLLLFFVFTLPSSLLPAAGGAPDSFSLPDTLWLARTFDTARPDSAFSEWKPLAFGGDRGETSFGADSVLGRSCLRARARAGGSGLLRPLELDPDSIFRIRWSWWVEGPVPGGDLTRKEGDDFAARVYVNFRFDPSRAGPLHRLKQRLASRRFGGEAPGKALVYVWGNQAPIGTVAFSAYTDQAAVVVLRSGSEGAGIWWMEERDVIADFRNAFGEEPPNLHSVAIMTDADDTGASADACYGDILILPRPSGPSP